MATLSIVGALTFSIATPHRVAAETGHSRGGPNALVSIGVSPVLPTGTRRVGSLGAHEEVHLDVVLKSRDAGLLAQYASLVAAPGSPVFRHYLSSSEFAQRFGAPSSAIDSVNRFLNGQGLSGCSLAPNHLEIQCAVPAGIASRAFSTHLESFELSDRGKIFANTSPPLLPSRIARFIFSVIGLDSISVIKPASLVLSRGQRNLLNGPVRVPRGTAHLVGPAPSPSCAVTANPANAGYTADEVASAYGLDNLYSTGDLGIGATIALIEFAPFLASDIAVYDACYGIAPVVNPIAVDGGPGPALSSLAGLIGQGQIEADLDVETISGLVPNASLDVYEGPGNADAAQILDTYTAAIDNPSVQVISTSWGDCEADLTARQRHVEATLFQQAAIEGKTFVAASGDNGSEDCMEAFANTKGAKVLAVDDPASQWYVTGIGGTTLSSINPVRESVWNDANQRSAGGGGLSQAWAMPPFQQNAASTLGVLGPLAHCGSGGRNCREVPDVSADAGEPLAVYCAESGPSGCGPRQLFGRWVGIGGTSAAAPIWASLIALANTSTSCAGKSPIGFANPALYAIAGGSGYSSAFRDITAGNNDLGFHRGLYPAAVGYDMASGLGSPIAGSGSPGDPGLVAQLCNTARATSFPAPIKVPFSTKLAIPTLTSIGPNSARSTGGAAIAIRGTNLGSETAVHFGARRSAAVVIVSAVKIIAIAPPGTGVVDVTVTTPFGTTKHVAGDKFRYLSSPAARVVLHRRLAAPNRALAKIKVGETPAVNHR